MLIWGNWSTHSYVKFRYELTNYPISVCFDELQSFALFLWINGYT